MSTTRKELKKYLNNLLKPYEFSDYGPNGLQIEGKEKIEKIAFSVSATAHSVAKAVEAQADALIVHHGLFWKFHGTRTITGPFAKRVTPLIQNEINLFGYHLPLDANLEVGNASGVAKLIDLESLEAFGDYKGSPTGVKGKLKKAMKASELKSQLEKNLNHDVLHSSPDDEQMIERVGIITGGANSDWYLAFKEGLDAYITGEMSEHDWHESKESGIHMYAGGHYATERFGVQSLKEKIEKDLKVDCLYIDSSNPA